MNFLNKLYTLSSLFIAANSLSAMFDKKEFSASINARQGRLELSSSEPVYKAQLRSLENRLSALQEHLLTTRETRFAYSSLEEEACLWIQTNYTQKNPVPLHVVTNFLNFKEKVTLQRHLDFFEEKFLDIDDLPFKESKQAYEGLLLDITTLIKKYDENFSCQELLEKYHVLSKNITFELKKLTYLDEID